MDRDDLSEIYRSYAEQNQTTGRWSQETAGNRFILSERDRVQDRLLEAHNLTQRELRVLDVGCGSATLLPPAIRASSRVGIDLLFERLDPSVRASNLDGVACADGTALPFPSKSFDLVVISTVLSSIPDATSRQRVGAEASRVLQPGGSVLWYDMRVPNPTNRNVRPISKAELRRCFPTLDLDTRTVTLIPQIARRLGNHERLYRALASVPMLRSHLAGVFTKH